MAQRAIEPGPHDGERRMPARLAVAILAVAAILVAGSAFSRILQATAHPWNDIRLVRSLALADGIPLYPGRKDGVLFDVVYGPAGLPFYLPAAWLPEPFWALLAGSFTSFILGFGPAAWLLWSPRMNGGADRPLRLLAIGLAFFHLLYAGAEYGVWNIHVDAPALAICSFAVYFAILHGAAGGLSRWLAASAFLAGMAPWTKQSTAPLIVVLCAFFLVSGRRRAAAWFAGIAVLTAVAAGVVFTFWFGFDNMYLSMFEMPLQHGLQWRKLSVAGRYVGDLLDIAATAAFGVLIWFTARDWSQPMAPAGASLWPGRSWVLCLAAAAGLAPTAIVAWVKQGGDFNNLAYIDYFLMLAGLLAMLQLSAASCVQARPVNLTALRLALAGLLAMQLLRSVPDVLRLPNDFAHYSRNNPSQMAFEYDEQHPGIAYFPWHPFAIYRSEGKLYHVGYAMRDRGRAGMPISEEHLRRYLPARMRYIAFSTNAGQDLMQRFPDYQCRVEIPQLANWEVLSRCAGDSGAQGREEPAGDRSSSSVRRR